MGPNDTLTDLFLELQVLDRVPRAGFFLRGVTEPESVSEHSFHLAFLVWVLASRESLDVSRAVEMALLHDLAEVRFGDLPRTAAHYLPPGAKKSAERAALDEILAPLAETRDAANLLDEYDANTSREARFVRACDRLQLLIKVVSYERWGNRGLGEFWRDEKSFDDGGFPQLQEIYQQLRQRRDELLS